MKAKVFLCTKDKTTKDGINDVWQSKIRSYKYVIKEGYQDIHFLNFDWRKEIITE